MIPPKIEDRTSFACKVFFINILRRKGLVFYAHKYANVKRAHPKFVCNIHKNASKQLYQSTWNVIVAKRTVRSQLLAAIAASPTRIDCR
uniref:Uncharacterized protein n=1 Tax=Glossina pallidipes TaxID=7398 RepID=A0A1B0AH44_GLOPL